MKKTTEGFDPVKAAEAANWKKSQQQEVPTELRKQFVREFKAFVAPAYDDHSFEAILELKSYQNFERTKLK